MLKEIDVSSIDQLMNETVPESIRLGQGQIFRHNNQQINGLDSTY
jgi:glycine cleavage system pyridoxal-binding protein P